MRELTCGFGLRRASELQLATDLDKHDAALVCSFLVCVTTCNSVLFSQVRKTVRGFFGALRPAVEVGWTLRSVQWA